MPDNRTTSRDLSFWDPNDPKWAGFSSRQQTPEDEGRTDQYLNGAKDFLANSPAIHDLTESRRAAAETYPDPQPAPQGLRGLTEGMEDAAGPIGLASIPFRPLGALAGGLLLPGAVRKLVAPQEDESRWGGAGQLGLAALAMLGAKGGRATPKLNTSPKPAGWTSKAAGISGESGEAPISLTSTYGGVGKDSGSLGESMAGLVGGRGGRTDDLVNELPESLKAFIKPANFRGKEEASAARKVRPSRARKVSAEVAPQSPENMLAQMNQESRSALKPRNVPSSDNPYLDMLPEGGLDTINPAEWRKLGLRQIPESIPSHLLDKAGEYGTNLLGSLEGNAARLGIPARARAFRNNTPFTE